MAEIQLSIGTAELARFVFLHGGDDMTQIAEQLKSTLAELDTKDRAALALFLIRSLDDQEVEVGDVDAAWEDEIKRRHEEMDSGKAILIPAEEVFSSIRSRLK